MAQAEDDGSFEIDELILNWSYLAAIQRIRERSGCSLREALEARGTRIEQLRDEAPERFAPQPERWEFYS